MDQSLFPHDFSACPVPWNLAKTPMIRWHHTFLVLVLVLVLIVRFPGINTMLLFLTLVQMPRYGDSASHCLITAWYGGFEAAWEQKTNPIDC